MDIALIILCLLIGYGAFDYFSKTEKHGCWLLSALMVLVVIFYFLSDDNVLGMLMSLVVVLGIVGVVGFLMYIFRK